MKKVSILLLAICLMVSCKQSPSEIEQERLDDLVPNYKVEILSDDGTTKRTYFTDDVNYSGEHVYFFIFDAKPREEMHISIDEIKVTKQR